MEGNLGYADKTYLKPFFKKKIIIIQESQLLCPASGSHVWVLVWKGILESGREEGVELRQDSDQSSKLNFNVGKQAL